MEKISVIIPFYNRVDTLNRCINSVVRQTYENLEILLIDDGSTDASADIVKEYIEKDNRVKLFQKPNGGVSTARNLGLENATGAYIKFQDSDDEMEPEMIEKLYNLLKRTGADMASCRFSHPCLSQVLKPGVYNLSDPSQMYRYYQDFGVSVLPWNKLYKAESITEKFDEQESFSEDELFNLANLKNMKKVAVTDELLQHYYVAPAPKDGNESLLNRLTQRKCFREKKTIWYLCDRLVPKRRKLVDNTDNMIIKEDYYYFRVLDYFFQELLLLINSGTTRQLATFEYCKIFKERDFIHSIRVKHKYGISFKKMNDARNLSLKRVAINRKVQSFINLCFDAYEDIKNRNLNLNTFYVFVNIFVKMFCTKNEFQLDTNDILANAMYDLDRNDTKEAIYVNHIKFDYLRLNYIFEAG